MLLFLAALVAILPTLLSSATASAATEGAAETRVGACSVVVMPFVGSPQHITAAQKPEISPIQVVPAVVTAVAAKVR